MDHSTVNVAAKERTVAGRNCAAAGQEPVRKAYRVAFRKAVFEKGVPQTDNNAIALGDLSLYQDHLSFTGEPANVGTLVSTALRGEKTVDRIWSFEEIQRAERRSCMYMNIDYDMMTITLTDGHSYSFSPTLPWKKELRKHNIEEMEQMWAGFHTVFRRWKNVVNVNELAFEQQRKGTAPDPQYILKMPSSQQVPHGVEKMKLTFQRAARIAKPGTADVEGVQYRLNGRIYKDHESLRGDVTNRISKELCLRKDCYDSPVLDVYTMIPAFDFYDREWDCWQHEYLMFDGKAVNLVVARGGYRFALLKVYQDLRSAPAVLRPWLEQMQIPLDTVKWDA